MYFNYWKHNYRCSSGSPCIIMALALIMKSFCLNGSLSMRYIGFCVGFLYAKCISADPPFGNNRVYEICISSTLQPQQAVERFLRNSYSGMNWKELENVTEYSEDNQEISSLYL
uniref:Uncharacterized protein n=1 Tax=Glossina brevipalpis TaxID=37001 RepID=A0A1A9W9Z9_9MUSC